MARLVRRGKPSRDGRSNSGEAGHVWSIDLTGFRGLPLALKRQLLSGVAREMGHSLPFEHVQALIALAEQGKRGRPSHLPGGLRASCSFRELQLSRAEPELRDECGEYEYALPLPGEISVSAIGSTIRARVISGGTQTVSGYNRALLLARARLQPEVTVRNWRACDRFFPAHTQSPKKVKELLQAGRLGRQLSTDERRLWPVIESAGQIVWMRGFPAPEAFAHREGDAVLIEEIPMEPGAEK